MSTKHTPGPWRVAEAMDGTMTEVMAGEIYIAPAVWQASAVWDRQQSEREANARLIAAAPEMLSLLQELIDIEGPQPGTSAWAEKVRATIAKARGEQ